MGPENPEQREILEVAPGPSHGYLAVLNLLRSVLFAGLAFLKTRH